MGIRVAMDRKASGEELMVLGAGMCAYGMWFKMYYIELAGFMFFFIGVLTLTPIKKEEGGLQEEGEKSENLLGRPPS